MSIIEWAAVLICIGIILIVWQLSNIAARLFHTMQILRSLDAEVFHLAQEQNPNYGICDKCGRRAIVMHVVPKARESRAAGLENFYCQGCWWMSDLVQVGDPNKHYKDRASKRDQTAASIGPR